MGTSKYGTIRQIVEWDHPHAYGDKLNIYNTRLTKGGIIPTRMGTSIMFAPLNIFGRDHPHAYGDKLEVDILLLQIPGSSPRVWGQDGDPLVTAFYDRIIPTRMGTRRSDRLGICKGRDHPHAYGDKL